MRWIVIASIVLFAQIAMAGGGDIYEPPQQQIAIEEQAEWWTPSMLQALLGFGAAAVPCAYGIWLWRRKKNG